MGKTMNGRKAKLLRRMAREEMVGDPDVEYFAAPKSNTSMVVSPNSVRGMHKALKKAYKKSRTAG